MKNDLSERKNVVLLVDNKHRDLMVATLIAHQLEETGVICHLEPLEAWRGVLAAYRPSMIIFNHINATHLVQYSKRLAEMGVKTAVLPNEGILYDPEVLNYNAGKHHNGAHIDMFFCWNQVHKDALLRCGFDQNTQIEVVGVPRFDYYFAPWSGIFDVQKRTPQGRPRLLFCTNFGFAKYYDLPKATAEEFMREYTCVSSYKDFWDLIETNHQCQQRFFDYITAAVAADRFDITLRPHPNEKLSVYQQWLDKLKPEWRGRVRLDRETHITQAILNCDLEISCETCTTAMESWIAGKPTVELVLKKHPVFYHKFHAGLNVACEKPEDLPRIVEEELAHPRQEAQRAEHLRVWCDSPRGASSARMAEVIANKLRGAKEPDWSKLNLTDQRRAAKLRFLRMLGLPYHFNPLLPVKSRLLGARYAIKTFAYRKSIHPRDVEAARRWLEQGLAKNKAADR